MAVYYIDPAVGSNANSGLSPDMPLADDSALALKPGDTVRIRRGSFLRGHLHNSSGEKGRPVVYEAYGEGPMPVLCGSLDMSRPEIWQEESPDIWTTTAIGNSEPGNFVFREKGGDESFGTLVWTKDALAAQGDFFDPFFGRAERRENMPSGHKIYLYSSGNPGQHYNHIECVAFGNRCMAVSGHDMVFDGLHFLNSGVHGIACGDDNENVIVKNCRFENIGGCVWNYKLRIRFGNAVEFWNTAKNITVSGCTFKNIYDSAVTHQGGISCVPADGFIIKDNVFMQCGMGAYEQRDLMPKYAEFTGNVCLDAGDGFSKLGEVMPRRSEIWPQPMGHHIFLWRIEHPTDGGRLIINDNLFLNARYGAAIYSIIAPSAEQQLDISGNRYYTENKELINRINGINYESFAEYRPAEKGAAEISGVEYTAERAAYFAK